jgi:uncharacterized membrane protein YjgN (DUF898 family)
MPLLNIVVTLVMVAVALWLINRTLTVCFRSLNSRGVYFN